MARILYGFSGDGFGHAARAKEVIAHLNSAGHQVCPVSYDKGYDFLSKFYPVERISGLRLSYADNEVRYLATVANSVLKSKETLSSFEKVKDLAVDFKPDLVISDFEPTVNLVAHWLKLPLVSLDNQHVINKTKIDVPERWLTEYMVAKLVVQMIVFKAKKYLILSFFHSRPASSKAQIIEPIIRGEVLALKPKKGNKVLVYLTSESNQSVVLPALAKTDGEFVVYGAGKKSRQGKVEFKAIDQRGFLNDLADAKAVIANAGFSLMTEALYLGKPFFALPIKSTFEQLINAHYLKKSGFGEMSEDLTSEELADFLGRLPEFEAKLKNLPRRGNAQAFAALDKTIVEVLKPK